MDIQHVCHICGHAFRRSGHLTQHIRTHTGERPYKCDHPGCDSRYSRIDHLRRHELSHHPEWRHLECPRDGCESRFATTQKLDRHLAAHDSPRLFQCEDCEESFVKKYQLAAHRTLHTGRKPYPCTVDGCSESFMRPNMLKKHHDNRHVMEKTYVCSDEVCLASGQLFTRFTDLRKHIRKMHPKERKTACDYCGAVFLKSNDLKNHIRTHEVPVADRLMFSCKHPGCNASYTKSSNLGTHIRSKHENTTAFVCSQCESPFSLKSSLKRHMKKQHNMDLPGSSRRRRKPVPSKEIQIAPLPSVPLDEDEAAAAAATAFNTLDDNPLPSPEITGMHIDTPAENESNPPTKNSDADAEIDKPPIPQTFTAIDDAPLTSLEITTKDAHTGAADKPNLSTHNPDRRANATALCVLPAITSFSVAPRLEIENQVVYTECNGTIHPATSLKQCMETHCDVNIQPVANSESKSISETDKDTGIHDNTKSLHESHMESPVAQNASPSNGTTKFNSPNLPVQMKQRVGLSGDRPKTCDGTKSDESKSSFDTTTILPQAKVCPV